MDLLLLISTIFCDFLIFVDESTFCLLGLAFYAVCCSQLFGEEDSDQDVSPDTQDPELSGDILCCVIFCKWFRLCSL